MRNLLLVILLCVGFVGTASADYDQNPRSNFSKFFPTSGENPFPWGTESPFPLASIDGTWKSTTAPLYFRFAVIRVSGQSNKYLKVTLLNRSNEVLATGAGVIRESDQVIRARVVGEHVDAYALVRAYNKRQLRKQCGAGECVMVVTLREPASTGPSKDLHYILARP